MKPLFTSTLLAASLFSLGTAVAQAQPDVQNAPKADNPLNRAVRPNLNNLPPAERLQALMRRQFTQMGVTAPATQDALLLYVTGETTARQTLVEKARQLQMALRGQVVPDAQITTMLNDYLAALEEDKTRRETAYDTLLKTVDIRKSPKVEAFLTLMGLANNAPNLMAGAMAGRGAGIGGRGALNGGGLGLNGGGLNGGLGLNGGAAGAPGMMPRLNRRQNGGGAMPVAPVAPAAGAAV